MSFWKCGRFELPLGQKTYVMGIVNVTPDSFSGDGVDAAQALERALRMLADGADILDIGGESTRPGAAPVSAKEELYRILPVVEGLVGEVQVPLSVDTTKGEVACAAVAAGASIINDISAGTFDPAMLDIVAASDSGYVLMHLRGTPQTMQRSQRLRIADCGLRIEAGSAKDDVISEVQQFWRVRLVAATAAGIERERIAVDAGFGFGKSLEENLELLRRGPELAAFGYPLLSGTSRKSTISKVLGDRPPEERVWGTAATVALAIAGGCDIVRVHDVREMAQVARMADAIVRVAKPGQ